MLRSTAVAILLGALHVSADFCSKGSIELGGNFYCQSVKHIKYSGVGHSGTYNVVTGMAADGSCSSTPKAFSGALAPFDEDLSVHLRGPVKLSQFAVYTVGAASKSKREPEAQAGSHQHRRHQHRRALGDPVVATIDGQVVTWANNYDGSVSSTPAAVAPAAAATAENVAPVKVVAQKSDTKSTSKDTSKVTSKVTTDDVTTAASGAWSRAAYYNSGSKTANGLVFLNNMGGQGSGVFDYVYGNSLSYASGSSNAGTSKPEVLSRDLESNQEIAIFSDTKCDDGCDFAREGTPAYYGWSGTTKIFAFEFQMPDDGTSGWNMNMPAIWLLNGRVPRTGQYVKAECSCWTSGCGELDLFEVLDSGNTRAKSTIHAQQAGGCSDYFDRPTSGLIQLVAVVSSGNVDIRVVSGFNFGDSISTDTVTSWSASDSSTSTFAMSS